MAMGRGGAGRGISFIAGMTRLLVLLNVGRGLMMCEAQGVAAVGSIQRTQMHQVLAALNTPSVNSGVGISTTAGPISQPLTTTQLFMTSQSGTFSAMLIRQQTNAAVGGLGADFCYVDVINTVARQSVWESPCEPITTTNPCIVLLSDNGLEIMDGNNKDVWNNGASNNYQSLVLLENGALQLVDKKGQTVWSSTDHARVNQNCGTVLQPGSSPFINPPFASPLQAQLPNGQPVFSQPFTTANPIVGSAPPQIIHPYYLAAAGCLIAIFFLP
jgi:hypothetical protein